MRWTLQYNYPYRKYQWQRSTCSGYETKQLAIEQAAINLAESRRETIENINESMECLEVVKQKLDILTAFAGKCKVKMPSRQDIIRGIRNED